MDARPDSRSESSDVGIPQSRSESKDSINQAVEVLKARHEVQDTSAFTMLVQASVDAHMNVQDTARRIVEAASTS